MTKNDRAIFAVMNCYKCLLPLLLLFISPASAQFTDSTFYNVNFTSSGSINSTNDGDAYLLNNGLKFGLRKKSISLNFGNSWIYGQQKRTLTNNDFNSHVDFNLYKTLPNFYYWGLGNYTTSYSLKINNQLQAGLGIAYNLLNSDKAYLNISDGILYEESDLKLTDTTNDVYNTFRNSFRLSFRFVIKGVIIVHGAGFLQNSLQYRNDYIIKSNMGLSLKLNKWLLFTTALTYNNISRTGRENMLFTYGLTIDQYF